MHFGCFRPRTSIVLFLLGNYPAMLNILRETLDLLKYVGSCISKICPCIKLEGVSGF
jgi:hypothetical protein